VPEESRVIETTKAGARLLNAQKGNQMDFIELEKAIDEAIAEAEANQGQWPDADLLKLGRLLHDKSHEAFSLFRAK